jgi:hypothetical protein
MDLFRLFFFALMLAVEIYYAYRLWRDPKGTWKKHTARLARIRAKTRDTIFSIFDAGPSGLENSPENYVFWKKLFFSLFIPLTLLLLIAAIINPK